MRCTNCGNEIPPNAKFCTVCGKTATENTYRQNNDIRGANSKESKTHGVAIAIIAISAAVVICCIVVACITLGSKPHEDAETVYKASNTALPRTEESKPENTPTPTLDSASQSVAQDEKTAIYRVRKSAEDASSQAGAFAVLDNAIKCAEKNKDSGYKVYDMDGNIIYIP